MAVRSSDCEIEVGGQWVVYNIDDVLQNDPPGRRRCVECHGVVKAHGVGKNGQAAHFEHGRRHSGCSRCDKFSGVKSSHPQALR